MNIVNLENVSHQYSERVLLDSVDLLINEGDRIGLIGRNGSGKTTLLRLIAGEETPNEGQITIWGGVRIQFLPQDPDLDDELTVLDTVFQSDAPQIRLLRDYEAASEALQRDPLNPDLQARLAQLTSEMDRTKGWAAEAEAKTILTKLGITQFDARVGTLSGGERKRVALAHGLIDRADLLILDEPTNHIDADTIDWLEQYLLTTPGALLMVTHDRYFLDRVVNKIVELDRRKLVTYSGNYGRYLELRAQREEQLQAAEQKRQALLRQELAWLRRGAQSRTTKQKARKQRIEELQTIRYDRGNQRVAMTLAGRRLGKKVLEATNLSKAYDGQPLFQNLDFQLNPGDRIGILGPNGAGKTTFLDLLAGRAEPDTGQIQWGQTVQLGYYDQQSAGLPDEKRVIEYINSIAPLIRSEDGERIDAADVLKWFLFPRPEQRSYVGSLSGGERRRLYLLATLIHRPNVLFLDEPTNDLDVQTLTVLEQFLDHFEGCLIVVSHDRYFLDRNVDFLMSFEAGVVGARYPAPYATYRRLREAEEEAEETAASQPPKLTSQPSPPEEAAERSRKLTWNEKQEWQRLEAEIETLTEKIESLETEVNEAGDDYVRLQELADELAQTRADLETAENRWLELSVIAEAS